MDRMYAPWRLAFVQGQQAAADVPPSPTGCIFCDYPRADDPNAATDAVASEGGPRAWDRRRLVVTTREHAFVVLNKYPYGNGHVMVVPRRHVDSPELLDDATFVAVQRLLRETLVAIRAAYEPDGINVGMNLGAAAGAGIAAHAHWHVLPRWRGDVNFLPAFADVKVIAESLHDTWDRLAGLLRQPHEG